MTIPKKTICFFNSNQNWGGGEKWHLDTCREMQRRGHNTFLVTNVRSELSRKGIEAKQDVFSFYVHGLSFINPFKILTLVALFKSQKVDAIILNLPSDLKVAGIAAKLARVKRIIYRRGMPLPLRNSWINRKLFQNILTHVVVNSEEMERSLTKGNEEWLPREKVVLVYNGVNTSRPLIHEKKLYEKQDSELVIGNAGRLNNQKGQKYLIELAELLKNDGVNFKILIAGEGELKESLMKMIRERDLSDEIKLLGHVEDMTGFFNSLDVFLFPSIYEGSANTLIETLQHGVPTVAFDISSNPEIIQHGVTGFLAKPFEVEELKKYVLLLRDDAKMRDEVVENGYRVLKSRFDSRENLGKLEILFL
jgi:glycosyltransferase involved in cell wall biosynthesis